MPHACFDVYSYIKYGENMKEWTFRFTDEEDDSWGWNSVWARGKKSAINKAIKKLKAFDGNYTLIPTSLDTSEDTYKQLTRLFW